MLLSISREAATNVLQQQTSIQAGSMRRLSESVHERVADNARRRSSAATHATQAPRQRFDANGERVNLARLSGYADLL